jgi:hypothetical protein
MNTHPMMAHEKMCMAGSDGYGTPGSPTIKSYDRSDNGRWAPALGQLGCCSWVLPRLDSPSSQPQQSQTAPMRAHHRIHVQQHGLALARTMLDMPALPLVLVPCSRIRDFQEDLRSKRSQQASDDMSGIGKLAIMAPADRFNARSLVSPEYNMVRRCPELS